MIYDHDKHTFIYFVRKKWTLLFLSLKTIWPSRIFKWPSFLIVYEQITGDGVVFFFPDFLDYFLGIVGDTSKIGSHYRNVINLPEKSRLEVVLLNCWKYSKLISESGTRRQIIIFCFLSNFFTIPLVMVSAGNSF